MEGAGKVFPVKESERILWVAVSLTAGFCEGFFYPDWLLNLTSSALKSVCLGLLVSSVVLTRTLSVTPHSAKLFRESADCGLRVSLHCALNARRTHRQVFRIHRRPHRQACIERQKPRLRNRGELR